MVQYEKVAESKFKMRWWYPIAFIILLATAALFPENTKTVEGTLPPPILVIDPGHGGADGGASGADGTLECDINLDIALRLNALAQFWGIDTELTRKTRDIVYPADAKTIASMKKSDQDARLALIRNTPGAVLVSIHQNYYPAGSPSGIQVLYGKTGDSILLGEITQSALTSLLCPNNKRVAEPISDDIYLMKNAGCTAILVECGFLSNPTELELLKTDTYRMQLAAILLSSYTQYTRGYNT